MGGREGKGESVCVWGGGGGGVGVEIMEELSRRSTIDSVSTYSVFMVKLSTRIKKQFNNIRVAIARSTMKSCVTTL